MAKKKKLKKEIERLRRENQEMRRDLRIIVTNAPTKWPVVEIWRKAFKIEDSVQAAIHRGEYSILVRAGLEKPLEFSKPIITSDKDY
jgi:hypothetical protein